MSEDQINDILEVISQIQEDSTIPKNIRLKLENVSEILQEDIEKSIKINKAAHILEELNDDINLQSFVRTQLWNISSMIEKI